MLLAERTSINLLTRVRLALLVVFSVFFLLIIRLWYLQVVQGDYFRELSENNRLRTLYIPPPRGTIFDRNGVELVKNRPSYNIELLSEDCPDPDATLRDLADVVGVGYEQLKKNVGQSTKKRRRFEPKLVLGDVSRDTVARVAARRHQLPGIIIAVTPARLYLKGEFASHTIGYIREITAAQLEQSRFSGYRMSDLVGKSGIEKFQENLLHGKRGVQRIVVNAAATRIGQSYFEPERAGHNVTLTLDARVQEAAENAMEGMTGTVVALAPETGEVLAMVSRPGFDPNVFTRGVSVEEWQNLIYGKENRLTNRAIQGQYPPGSVFKIIMAVAGLAEGVISIDENVSCPGYYRIGNSRPFHCHKRGGHGHVDVIDAIQKSCNVFFYTVGQRLGIDRIHDYAVRFGFGEPVGLNISDEPEGIVPSKAWKRAYFKTRENQRWYPGETPSVSIGQGALSVTPMQVARAMAALVNGGELLSPYLVKRIESHDGRYFDDSFEKQVVSDLGISKDVLNTVRDGLFAVVNKEGGTARRARLPEAMGVKVAGKTGTAQIKSLAAREQEGNKETDLAWFAGYAPAEGEAEIVVVAVIEDGGHGGVTAAPVVRAVLEAFFHDRLPPDTALRASPAPAVFDSNSEEG